MENAGVYARIKLLDHLPKKYTCIVFDRRETGQSGGRSNELRGRTTSLKGEACSNTSTSSAPTLWAAAWAAARRVAFAVAHPRW